MEDILVGHRVGVVFWIVIVDELDVLAVFVWPKAD